MAGPIERAFIEIVAELETGNLEDELSAAVRRAVSRAAPLFTSLEKRGVETAQAIGEAFRRIQFQIDARQALISMAKIEAATDTAGDSLRRIAATNLKSLGSEVAVKQLERLETQVKALSSTLHAIDDDNISPDFDQMEQALRNLLLRVDQLQKAFGAIDVKGLGGSALEKVQKLSGELDELGTTVSRALKNVERLNEQKIDIEIEDIGFQKMFDELDRMEKRLKEVDRLNPEVKITVNEDGINKNVILAAEQAARKGADKFASVFRRSLEFGFVALITRDLAQVVTQFFRAGLQAAGEIQTAQVALNRFFSQSRDLGESSVEFFKDLRDLAIETPFEFGDLADVSRRLLAMQLDAKEAKTALEDVGDAVASVGGGTAEIQGVVKALSQISSKGKVDLQDLRQISERLPSLSRQMQIQGIIDEFNRLHPTINATIADFNQLRKEGAITGKIVRDGILKAIQDIPGAEGAARAAARTLQGALVNLADFAKFEFADAFGDLGGQIADALNEAFDQVGTTKQLDTLAGAISRVIQAGGRAGEKLLQPLIDSAIDLAEPVENLVDRVTELGEQAIPLLESALKGSFTALTGATSLLTSLGAVLNTLPDGFKETASSLLVMAKIVPGAGEALILPFKLLPGTLQLIRAEIEATEKQAAGLINAVTLAEQQRQTAEQKGAFFNSLLPAGITLGALLLFDQFSRASAAAAQKAADFARAVRTASDSFREFTTTGEAVLDFLNEFNDAANKIKIEPGVDLESAAEKIGQFKLKNPFEGGGGADALTTGELATQLGITFEQLGALTTATAKFRNSLGTQDVTSWVNALHDAGINVDSLAGASGDAQANLQSLADQTNEGAGITLRAAASSKEFAFVQDDVIAGILGVTEVTGDNVTGLEKLREANNDAAKAQLEKVAAGKLDSRQLDELIAKHTSYEIQADGSTKATIDYMGAVQELTGELQAQQTLFESLNSGVEGFSAAFAKATDGVGDTARDFVQLAVGMKEANLSTEEFTAVADQLGLVLDRVFTGGELQKIAEALVADIGKIQTAFEGVLPGISDLQKEADGFSLDKFIDELGRIGKARAEVILNSQILVDKFGQLGADALQALIDSGLSKDAFAIALDEAVNGDSLQLNRILTNFKDATAAELNGLPEQLAAFGLTSEEIDKILGVDAFKEGADQVVSTVKDLKASLSEELIGLVQLKGTEGGGQFKSEIANLIGETRTGISEADAAAVPGVDVDKATAEAKAAGEQVGAAFQAAVVPSVAAASETITTSVTDAFARVADSSSIIAFTSGLAAGGEFVRGLRLVLSGAVDPTAAANIFNSLSDVMTAPAENVGSQIGAAMEFAMVGKLQLFSTEASGVLNEALVGLGNFTGLFEGVGLELGGRFVGGMTSTLDQVLPAATQTLTNLLGLFDLLAPAFQGKGFVIGQGLGQGLVIGLRSQLDEAYAAGAAVAGQAEQGAKDESGSRSPSKVFEGIGEDLVAGLTQGIVGSSAASTNAMVGLIRDMSQAGSDAPIADTMTSIFNVLIDRVNDAFMFLAARLGAAHVFAGAPVQRFGQGLVATTATAGVFGEAGPEALIPLSDGAAAARIIAQLAPFLGAQGRAAAAEAFGLDGQPSRPGSSRNTTIKNDWHINVPTDDPEAFARRAEARLARRLQR